MVSSADPPRFTPYFPSSSGVSTRTPLRYSTVASRNAAAVDAPATPSAARPDVSTSGTDSATPEPPVSIFQKDSPLASVHTPSRARSSPYPAFVVEETRSTPQTSLFADAAATKPPAADTGAANPSAASGPKRPTSSNWINPTVEAFLLSNRNRSKSVALRSLLSCILALFVFKLFVSIVQESDTIYNLITYSDFFYTHIFYHTSSEDVVEPFMSAKKLAGAAASENSVVYLVKLVWRNLSLYNILVWLKWFVYTLLVANIAWSGYILADTSPGSSPAKSAARTSQESSSKSESAPAELTAVQRRLLGLPPLHNAALESPVASPETPNTHRKTLSTAELLSTIQKQSESYMQSPSRTPSRTPTVPKSRSTTGLRSSNGKSANSVGVSGDAEARKRVTRSTAGRSLGSESARRTAPQGRENTRGRSYY